MWNKDTRNFNDHVDDNLQVGDEVKTGFAENYYATVTNEIHSGLSISKFLMEAPIREQNEALLRMAQSDSDFSKYRTVDINEDGRPVVSYDYDGMADEAISRGDEDIVPYADLRTQISESVLQADNYQRDISKNSTGMGTIGEFAGAVAVQVAEPVNYIVVIPGIGAASSLGLKVLAGAGAGALSEAVIQPFVQEWKNTNEIKYTDEDVAFAVGTSTVFGGLAGGAGHYIGKMIKGMEKESARIGLDARGNAMDEKEALDAGIESLQGLHREVTELEQMDTDISIGEKLRTLDDRVRAQQEMSPHVTVEPPSTNTIKELGDEQVRFEEALGIKRSKPETPEGVEVDPDALDVIEFDPEKFDFEMNGRKASDIVRDTDAEIKMMNDTINCMMGG